jgi:molybdopterin converting factor subunit 1
MKIKVLYFASYREIVGHSNETIELDDNSSLNKLKKQINIKHPNLKDHWDVALISVNKAYSNHNVILKDGDEVALLPPISGG